jgi:hypothetical protein
MSWNAINVSQKMLDLVTGDNTVTKKILKLVKDEFEKEKELFN